MFISVCIGEIKHFLIAVLLNDQDFINRRQTCVYKRYNTRIHFNCNYTTIYTLKSNL